MTQTLNDVLTSLKKAGKPTSRRQLYRYLKAVDINPVGARQNPRLYPHDTSRRVLEHLGLTESRAVGVITVKQALDSSRMNRRGK